MESYKELLRYVLDHGRIKTNRTGIDTISVSGYMFQHDMRNGFPLLTTKKMAYKSIFSELEFFIKGYHDKQWLKDHNNHIWDEWCSPLITPYSTSDKVREKMKESNELGPIYGVQWRSFDAHGEFDANLGKYFIEGKGTDQLKYVVDTIKNDPESRRIICSAWNPNQIKYMALPPCHVLWQILVNIDDNTMDLIWYQRSVDTMLGLPFNIASYAALLELLCLECDYEPGKLIGMLGDVHIYDNHINAARMQLDRPCHKLPKFKVNNFTSIFDFDSSCVEILDYTHEDKIVLDVAV